MHLPKLPLLFGSLALVSATILSSQVLLVRESRVSFGFGFEFIIFSFAIAGMGLGGLFVYFFSRKKPPEEMFAWLMKVFPIFAILTVISTAILHYIYLIDFAYINLMSLLFFLSSLAFYCAGGIVITVILRFNPNKLPLVYFFDLVGGAVGALIVVFLMDSFGTPTTALVIYMTAVAAAILYFLYQSGLKRSIIPALILLALPLIFPIVTGQPDYLQITCSSRTSSQFVESNSFSQVNVDPLNSTTRSKEVLGADYIKGVSPFKLYNLSRDCKPSIAYIMEYKNLNDVSFLLQTIDNLPYLLRNFKSVFEIGTGPGNWVTIGALNKIPNVTAVEINPLVIKAFDRTVDYNVYDNPLVHLHIEEGRNYLSSHKQNYDMIYLFTKTYGGIGLASYAFSENYLFTKDAYNSYLDHLSDHGMLAIGGDNWYSKILEETLIPTLQARGLDPTTHLMIARSQNYSMVLVAKDGFSQAERDKLVALSGVYDYQTKFIGTTEVTDAVTKNIDVSDNRPFLLDTADLLKNIGSPLALGFPGSEESILTIQYLLWLLALTAIAWAAVIILPFKLRQVAVTSTTIKLITFFSLLATGFITFELGLVQKSALFLERPEWPISVVLASILFFGGLGSLVTTRIGSPGLKRWASKIMVLFILLSFVYLFFFDFAFINLAGLSEAARISITVLVLALPSFLAGMIFPIGLRLTGLLSVALIPWMYGIDGVTSVLGGVISKLNFLLFGFRVEFAVGILAYVLALLVLLKLKVNEP